MPGLLRNRGEFFVARPERGREGEAGNRHVGGDGSIQSGLCHCENISFSEAGGSPSGVWSRGVTYELTGALCWVRIGSRDQGGSREP